MIPTRFQRSNSSGISHLHIRALGRARGAAFVGAATVGFLWLGGVRAANAAIVISGDGPDGVGNFGTNGDVGFVNSPPDLSISFGADGQGSIYQLDGFVNVAGQNLNNTGDGFGTSADLSYGAPAGITFAFSAAQPTADQVVLSYQFTNTSGAVMPGFQFLSYVDGDIGPNYADESATLAGTTGSIGDGGGATTYQIGDPSLSTLFTNESFGTLDDINDFAPPASGDVADGLGFDFGDLAAGQTVTFNVLLSDDNSTLGSLAIDQTDPVYTGDTLAVSGDFAVAPEPCAAGMLAVVAVAALGRRTRSAARRG